MLCLIVTTSAIQEDGVENCLRHGKVFIRKNTRVHFREKMTLNSLQERQGCKGILLFVVHEAIVIEAQEVITRFGLDNVHSPHPWVSALPEEVGHGLAEQQHDELHFPVRYLDYFPHRQVRVHIVFTFDFVVPANDVTDVLVVVATVPDDIGGNVVAMYS